MNDNTSDHNDASDPDMAGIKDAAAAFSDEEIKTALIRNQRLSTEVVTRIEEVAQSLQMRFADAAVHTGAVQPRDLEDTLAWMRQRAPRAKGPGGIFEQVMQIQKDKPVGGAQHVVIYKGQPLQPGRRLVIAHEPGHPRSEELRRLRQELMLRTASRRGAAFFALLSPSAREGRSQLAAELAIAFAQLGRRTLLVDADLRRPCQHEIFGATNETGLAQALAGDAPANLNSVEGLPKMAVLTSGGQPPNPVELLYGPRFERMIAEWRRTFEFVVLDTPPTTEFSDALTVANAAGNVLVLSRAKTTAYSALKEMRRHLEPTQTRIVGAVINSF